MKGIAVAGNILVDKINTIDAYPQAGKLVQIRNTHNSVGGLVPNVGIDLKKICPHLPIYAFGRVGDDFDGDFVVDRMAREGVITCNVKRAKNERTSFTSVMSVPNAERTFFTYAGASANFGFDDIDFCSLDVKMFHLGYFLLLDKIDGGDGLKILKELKERGISTSIDLVSEQSDRYQLVLPCLPYVDNLIVNELEACALTNIKDDKNLQSLCRALQKMGVRERVIVHKQDCCACLNGNKFTQVNSLNLPKGWVKGKTGAGDAFTAGCLIGIYNGMSDEKTLDFAVRSAAVSLLSENAVDAMTDQVQIYQMTKEIE